MNLVQIARSWFQFAKGDDHTKALMEERLRKCDKCEHKVQLNEFGQVLVKMVNKEGNLFKCSLCNCPLAGKTAHPGNKCPIDKWGLAGST